MQMIYDSVLPENLDKMRKLMEAERREIDPKAAALALDETIRAKRDRAEEEASRVLFANRHERRRAKVLAR